MGGNRLCVSGSTINAEVNLSVKERLEHVSAVSQDFTHSAIGGLKIHRGSGSMNLAGPEDGGDRRVARLSLVKPNTDIQTDAAIHPPGGRKDVPRSIGFRTRSRQILQP